MLKSSIFFLLLIGICSSSCLSDQYTRDNARVINHVKFSGKIISLNASRNHAYGIIGISVSSTNRKEFVDSLKSNMFPYRLSNGYAEFYGYVLNDIKVGFYVELDSDKRIMKIYDNNKLVTVTDVAVTSDKINMEFVLKNSKFKLIDSN